MQDGAELIPTFNWPQDRLLLLMAGGKEALLRSAEDAEDETGQAHRGDPAAQRSRAPDVVIAVAASGTTPFTLTCLREAKRRGALTIGIANNRDTPILTEADCSDLARYRARADRRLDADEGRHRAARRRSICLSSLVMIRLGRVHEGLMVDVQAINAKLAAAQRKHSDPADRPQRREEVARRARSGPTAASSSRSCCCMAAASIRRPGRWSGQAGGCAQRSETSERRHPICKSAAPTCLNDRRRAGLDRVAEGLTAKAASAELAALNHSPA